MCLRRLALSDTHASYYRCFIINPHSHRGFIVMCPTRVSLSDTLAHSASNGAFSVIWRHVRRTAREIRARIAIHYAAHSLFKATERYVGGLILFGLERFLTHYHKKKLKMYVYFFTNPASSPECSLWVPFQWKGCRYLVPSMPPLHHSVQRVSFPVWKMGCSTVRKQWIKCDAAKGSALKLSGCGGKKDSDAEWQRLRQALFLRIALSETVVTNKPAVKIEMVRRHTNKQNQQKTLPKEEKLTALI